MIYVVIQFSCIIYLIFNAKIEHLDTLNYGLVIVSIIIGISAVINMKPDNLNIVPTLKDRHQLVTSGIYRLMRHPMYTSVLLFCLALTLTNPHNLALSTMLVLFIDLILKSNLEERLLGERFNRYQIYKNKTGKFLPFL